MHYEERSLFSPSLVWLFDNSPHAKRIEVGDCVAKSWNLWYKISSSSFCQHIFAAAREPETSPERSLMRASIVRPEAWFCTRNVCHQKSPKVSSPWRKKLIFRCWCRCYSLLCKLVLEVGEIAESGMGGGHVFSWLYTEKLDWAALWEDVSCWCLPFIRGISIGSVCILDYSGGRVNQEIPLPYSGLLD